MDQYLYKFLVMNGHLALPQLGRVDIVQQPACFSEENGNLLAPRPVLTFAGDESQLADRQLLSFLANETGEDETAVAESFLAFIRSFKEVLASKGKAVMEGVGVFSRDGNNDVQFQPSINIDYLLHDVYAGEPVVAEIIPDETTDAYWWYYALILFILGLGALAYYYI